MSITTNLIRLVPQPPLHTPIDPQVLNSWVLVEAPLAPKRHVEMNGKGSDLEDHGGYISVRTVRHIKRILARNLVVPPAASTAYAQSPISRTSSPPTFTREASFHSADASSRTPASRNNSIDGEDTHPLLNKRLASHRPTKRTLSSASAAERLFHEKLNRAVCASTHQLPTLYYTLSRKGSSDHDTPFYVSEILPRSLNPSWNTLDQESYISPAPLSATCLTMRVHARLPGCDKVHTVKVLSIDLSKLTYLGEEISQRMAPFPTNTIILSFIDGYFSVCKTDAEESTTSKYMGSTPRIPHALSSYTCDSLHRIVTTQKAISDTRQEVIDCFAKAIPLEDLRRRRLATQVEREEVVSRLQLLRTKVCQARQDIETAKSELSTEADLRKTSGLALGAAQSALSAERAAFENILQDIDRKKYETFSIRQRIRRRQRKLILEVSDIFRLSPIPDQPLSFTIRDVHLPNSEFTGELVLWFCGADDEKVATALGFTCHLTSLIAYYLELPLRYPIKAMSSRSTITDLISEHFAGNKEFPLYARGMERIRFEYAVFLLNKDIEQIMHHLGLTVRNLRNTLPNLKQTIAAIEAWEV
ncbi:UV radiation resistance protein and autophagy-related subunit 14-domain-containing protein [Gaertneriomyces semiglobifer]|nr:UV radiation resistance protein and autophagy-related subunit 14-domain-containing protein [Gaertneriomyces semiglobifer]